MKKQLLTNKITPPTEEREDLYVRYILFYLKCYKNGFKRLAKVLYWLNRFVFSCDIPCTVTIGKRLSLPHFGLGVVIHPCAIIGDHVKIYQQVTIGARGNEWHPIIDNNVLIGAGAKILGSVHVGNGAKVGANSVVLSDVPANATAVGLPAKIIQK